MGRKFVVNVTLTVIFSVALALAGVEIVLRFLDIPFSGSWTPSENAVARYDSELGWSYLPGRSYLMTSGRDPVPFPVHFDRQGIRVPSGETRFDPDLPTVLLVGGSYAMGHGLPYESTFAGFLDNDEDFPFQVVNLGVQAYGTDQSLLALRRHIDRFRCVRVIYTFIDAHILRNSNHDRRLIYPGGNFIGTKPLFVLDDDGGLRLDQRPSLYEDLHEFHLWDWIRLARYRQNLPLDLDLTRALVKEMQSLAESMGAEFTVVYWKQKIRYPPGLLFTRWEGADPLEGLGVDVVDTAIDPPPGWDSWVIPGEFHPDRRAHSHVADILLKKIGARREVAVE